MWQTSDSGEDCHKCNAQRCLILMALPYMWLHFGGSVFGTVTFLFLGSSYARHTIESNRPKWTARYANHGREFVIRTPNIVVMAVKTLNVFILTCANTMGLWKKIQSSGMPALRFSTYGHVLFSVISNYEERNYSGAGFMWIMCDCLSPPSSLYFFHLLPPPHLLSVRSPDKRLEGKFALWRRRKRGEYFHMLFCAIYSLPCFVDVQRKEKREWNWLWGKGERWNSALIQKLICFFSNSIYLSLLHSGEALLPPHLWDIETAQT